MVEPTHPRLLIARQCLLLGISRSTFYNEHRPHSSLDDQTPEEAYSRNNGTGSPVPVGPQAAA